MPATKLSASKLGAQSRSRGFGRNLEEEDDMAVKPAKKKRVFDDDDDDRVERPKGKLKVKTAHHSDVKSLAASAKQMPSVRLTFKEGEARTVRFLHDPFDEDHPWVEFYEHSLQNSGGWQYVPCIEGCKLDGDVRAAKRWYVNVWDRDSKAVKLLKLTGAMVENLIIKYEKRGTLLDRDYSITRTGEGTDTKYHIEPEDKERFNMKGVKLVDIENFLDQQAQSYYGGGKNMKAKASSIDDDEDEDDDDVEDEDEEDEEEETPKRKKGRKVVDEDEDDEDEEDESDEDEDEEDEEEDEKPAKRRKAPAAKRRAVAEDDDDDDDEGDDDDDEDEDEEDEAPKRKTSKTRGTKTAPKKRPLGKRR